MSKNHRSFTTALSRIIVNHIKYHSSSLIPEIRFEQDELLVIATVVERTTVAHDVGGVNSATYNSLSKTIRIELSVPLNINSTWWMPFIAKLKKVIRHEYEHYVQHKRSGDLSSDALKPLLIVNDNYNGKPTNKPWLKISDALRYLLNPIEVEAHVMGIAAVAKYRKIKFNVVLKEVLKDIEEELSYDFKDSHIRFLLRRVYETWGFYALARFPSLRVKRQRRLIGFNRH